MPQVQIINGAGERELFDPEKLKNSLRRAGASAVIIDDIVSEIESWIMDGMTTSHIYRSAFKILKKHEAPSAFKYSMRRSLMTLGPSGFPFEQFVAEIFKAKGYTVQTGMMLQGKCVQHEVDVVAYKENELWLVEAKFHNQKGIKSDTKTALYVKARFDDLAGQTYTFEGKKYEMTHSLLITNTKFTENSKVYGRCNNNLNMISWEYPEFGNLYDLIDQTGVHPLTCIPNLTKKNKKDLINKGVVTCHALADNIELLRSIGVRESTIKKVDENIDQLCTENHKH